MSRCYPVDSHVVAAALVGMNDIDWRTAGVGWVSGHSYVVGGSLAKSG